LTPSADISDLMDKVEELLDRSIKPADAGYVIAEPYKGGSYFDLSKIDFEALRKHFEKSRKRVEVEQLRGHLNAKLQSMVRRNPTRMDYYKKLQELIEEYNSGAKNVDAFFEELVALAQDLNEEEKRAISEQLDEESLTIFDMLTKPEVKLSREEKTQVKEIARELLDTLKAERLVLDWRKQQKTRAAVQLTIEKTLDKLPKIYTTELYRQKCDVVYQHIYDAYYGDGKSIYSLINY